MLFFLTSSNDGLEERAVHRVKYSNFDLYYHGYIDGAKERNVYSVQDFSEDDPFLGFALKSGQDIGDIEKVAVTDLQFVYDLKEIGSFEFRITDSSHRKTYITMRPKYNVR